MTKSQYVVAVVDLDVEGDPSIEMENVWAESRDGALESVLDNRCVARHPFDLNYESLVELARSHDLLVEVLPVEGGV